MENNHAMRPHTLLDKILHEVNTIWGKLPDRVKVLFAADRFIALDPDSPLELRLAHARNFISRYRKLNFTP